MKFGKMNPFKRKLGKFLHIQFHSNGWLCEVSFGLYGIGFGLMLSILQWNFSFVSSLLMSHSSPLLFKRST